MVHFTASILVHVVFSCNKSDSLEHFHSKCLSSNSSNHIDSIFLLLDVVSPDKQDISSLVNVMVFSHSSSQGVESLLKVLVELILQSSLLGNLAGKFISLFLVSPLFSLSLLLKSSPCHFLFIKFSCKFSFLNLE